MLKQDIHKSVTNADKHVTISEEFSRLHVMPPWKRLLYRLLSLPDGCHVVTVIRDGEELRWSVQSGDVEQ